MTDLMMEGSSQAKPAGNKRAGTRRSVKKSRAGCAKCKGQHIKCDEARPHCGRCERLGMKCPGYATQLKWSTKHEVNQESATTTSGISTPANDYDWLDFNLPPATPAMLGNAIIPINNDGNSFTGLHTPNNMSEEALMDVWNATENVTEEVVLAPELNPLDFQMQPIQNRNGIVQPLLQALGVRRRDTGPRIQMSLTHQPYELISYYFKMVPGVYSTFDNHKNPFRGVVSSLYSHSLAVNLAAQSMAAAYLAECHPRFAELGMSLRQQCLDFVASESNNDYDVLLALIMSGPTGNWHNASDLGLTYYDTMRNRLAALAAAGKLDQDYHFFAEAMVLWEVYLSFTSDSSIVQRHFGPSPAIEYSGSKKEVHPWTGVGGDTLKVIADIGRLVRANRFRSRNQKFVTQYYIEQMSQDLAQARELERRLLACYHPDDNDVVNTEDNATPVWHITTIAELHRYSGLLQLYKVFPDLLSDRLRNESFMTEGVLADLGPSTTIGTDHADWLRAFSMEALRQLESIPTGSGTKDFQPFLLVIFASELACEGMGKANETSGTAIFDNGSAVSTTFAEVAIMRKFVVDRLTSFCRQIPPKPLRVCLDIIKETWRRIDSGQQNVYWLDVMIENGWETIMA